MIAAIFLIIVALVFLKIIWETFYEGFWEGVLTTFSLTLLYGLTYILSSIIAIKDFPDGVEPYSVHTKTLFSAYNSDKLEGSFFLGSGHIGEKEYVKGFSKDDNGIVSRELIEMEGLKFKEVDTLSDKAELYCTYKYHNIFGGIVDNDDCLLKIPNNTIIKRMEIE